MKTRQEYEQFINERFDGKSKELLLKNVELYYKKDIDITKINMKLGKMFS